MSWIRHRRPNFSPDFSAFFLDLHTPSRQNPGQAPVHVLGTWHPCAGSHATAPGPAITHVADAPSARPHHVPTF